MTVTADRSGLDGDARSRPLARLVGPTLVAITLPEMEFLQPDLYVGQLPSGVFAAGMLWLSPDWPSYGTTTSGPGVGRSYLPSSAGLRSSVASPDGYHFLVEAPLSEHPSLHDIGFDMHEARPAKGVHSGVKAQLAEGLDRFGPGRAGRCRWMPRIFGPWRSLDSRGDSGEVETHVPARSGSLPSHRRTRGEVMVAVGRARSPQEKKALSHARDRRNDYAENDRSSRKSIRRRKRDPNRSDRHRERQVLGSATGTVVNPQVAGTPNVPWPPRSRSGTPCAGAKWRDALLADIIENRLRRRERAGMDGPALAEARGDRIRRRLGRSH